MLFGYDTERSIAQKEHLNTSPKTRMTCSLSQGCYSHTRDGELSWCFNSSLFFSVGFSTQEEAMSVARSAS